MKKEPAFTLIELSIVLVIIGLIVGGILVAQDLIKAAEMRQTVAIARQYEAAAQTFRLKYNQMPGDFSRATQFFTASSDCDASGGYTGTNGVCNGDGNGRVDSLVDRRFLLGHLIASDLVDLEYDNLESYALNNIITVDKGYFKGALNTSEGEQIEVTYFSSVMLLEHYVVVGANLLDLYTMDNKFDDGSGWTGNIYVTAESDGRDDDESLEATSCVDGNGDYRTEYSSWVGGLECRFTLTGKL